MNWLIKWGVKKWLVGVVNTALTTYAGKVEKARNYLAVTIGKVEATTAFLKTLDAKLSDNKVTDGEVDAAIQDAIKLAAALVKKEG